jgi:hypothetical protein
MAEKEETKNETATAVSTKNVTKNEEIDWWTKYYASKQVILFIDTIKYPPFSEPSR